MKLHKPKCPKCGKPAVGTVERVPATALFGGMVRNEDGTVEVEYTGETVYDYDGDSTVKGPHGARLLTCGEHDWEDQTYQAKVTETKERRP
jgi:hypothetical protein